VGQSFSFFCYRIKYSR